MQARLQEVERSAGENVNMVKTSLDEGMKMQVEREVFKH